MNYGNKMYNIGITGTRNGMNELQFNNIDNYFGGVNLDHDLISLHHGDCIGADVETAIMGMEHGFQIICHPPIVSDLSAYHNSDIFREPHTYFKRNRNIVDECEVLLVVPMDNEPQIKGGTWYTWSYAKNKNIPVIIFYPDGRVVHE